MTEPETVVIFRVFPDADGGEVIAFFPCEPGDTAGLMCDSYMHNGQHGQASPNLISRTRPATPAEYAALKAELEAPPFEYNLTVLRRTPPDAARQRRNKVHRQRAAALNRIITPDNSPDRFTDEETALFRAGKCSWQTGYGLPWTTYCGQPSKPGASCGYCAEHEAELLEDYYPDGTPRRR